jgi:hypothetical protein
MMQHSMGRKSLEKTMRHLARRFESPSGTLWRRALTKARSDPGSRVPQSSGMGIDSDPKVIRAYSRA